MFDDDELPQSVRSVDGSRRGPAGHGSPRWRAYGLALTATLATLLLRLSLWSWIGSDRPVLILFLIPIIFGAYVGGLGPGLLSTGVAALGTSYFLMLPTYSFSFTRSVAFTQWLILILSGVLISGLNEALHRARRGAEAVARERERTEDALREREQQWNALIENIPLMVFVKDARDLRYVRLNRAAEQFTGIEEAEIVGRTDFDLCQRERAEYLTSCDRRVIESGEMIELPDDPMSTPQGVRIFHTRKVCVPGADGQPRFVLGISVDVTERKQAEARLQDTLSLTRATLDSTADGILAVDRHGHIEAHNRRFAEMWHLPADLLERGSDDEALSAVLDQLAEPARFVEKVRELYASPEADSFDVLRFKDGRVFERYSLPQRQGTEVVGRVWSFRDVTERERAARALAESEERHRIAVEAADLGTWYHDFMTDLVHFDARAAAHFGFGTLAIRFPEMAGRVHPDDRERTVHDIAARLDPAVSDGCYALEHRVVHPSGEVRWLSVQARVRFGGDGAARQPMYTIGTTLDVTERKQAEQQLRLQASALQSAANGIVITDRDGTIQWVNAAFTNLTGYSAAEAVGHNPRMLKSDIQDPVFYKDLWDAIAAGRIWHGVLINKRKDGAFYTEEMTITPVRADGTGISHFIAIKQDVSERKRAEAALRRSEENLNRAQAVSHTGSWLLDVANNTVEWSDETYRIFGVPLCTRLTPNLIFDRIHPTDRQVVVTAWMATRAGAPYDIEHRIVVDGVEKWVREQAEIHFGPNGTSPVAVGTTQDITERKRAEEALLRSQKLEALGTLAGGIAHDFNNILLAITGNAKLALADLPPDHPVQESLSEIAKASTRAVELVRRILAFSRPQDQRRETLHLRPVVEEALKLVRATLPAMIEIQPDFAPDTPAVVVDPTQLHQIIVNLATNAAHAIGSQRGRIEVRLAAVDVDAELAGSFAELHSGRYARLVVRDSGCGMERATLGRIFDPFFTTKAPGQGTGLGLSVVHGIMKSYGGAITVESTLGQGATFSLYFPAADGAVDRAAAAPALAAHGQGQRVLYVDDDEALVVLVARLLGQLGYRVTGCTNAAEALEDFRARPDGFDVVVTDLSMPGMSGFDLARQLLAVRSNVPILLTSGYVQPEDEETALRMGLVGVVLKPDSVAELGHALDRVFRDRSRRDASPATEPGRSS